MQNVTCIELKIDGDVLDEEAFLAMAEGLQSIGCAEEIDVDTGAEQHIAWFDVAADEKKQMAQLHAAVATLGAQAEQWSIAVLNDDWATAWQKNWVAMPVGKTLCVRPSFCDTIAEREVDIILEPGMAFGTGTHPTTFLCLEAIETYCAQQAPQSLLDMGSGSGLLAIAAGKLGALDIHAVDFDPLSVSASAENAEINGVSLTATLGDTPPARQFELVVANILAGPLLEMAESLSQAVASHLILSGLLSTQVAGIIVTYEAQGLHHHSTQHKEEWSVVEFKRLA